jgi:hypothetical protein
MNFVPRFDDINIVPAKLRQISVDKKWYGPVACTVPTSHSDVAVTLGV